MSATLYLGRSAHDALATPYSLSERRKNGLPPAAEMRIVIPRGKSDRIVTVELDQDDLCRLISAAASALDLLRGVDQ